MTTLYRHYDKEGNLLYIGISENEPIRRKQHKRGSNWFKQIASVTIEHYETRKMARDAERNAILNEKPLWNISGKILPKKRRNNSVTLYCRKEDVAILKLARKLLRIHEDKSFSAHMVEQAKAIVKKYDGDKKLKEQRN